MMTVLAVQSEKAGPAHPPHPSGTNHPPWHHGHTLSLSLRSLRLSSAPAPNFPSSHVRIHHTPPTRPTRPKSKAPEFLPVFSLSLLPRLRDGFRPRNPLSPRLPVSRENPPTVSGSESHEMSQTPGKPSHLKTLTTSVSPPTPGTRIRWPVVAEAKPARGTWT
jgi:hypothetical protein